MIDINGEIKYFFKSLFCYSVLKIISFGGVGYYMYEEKNNKIKNLKENKKVYFFNYLYMSNMI